MRGRLADLSSLVYVYNFIRDDVLFSPLFFIEFIFIISALDATSAE